MEAPLVTGSLPRSLPALAWALRAGRVQTAGVESALELLQRPVQAYRVQGETAALEAESAAHAIRHASERLRRLSGAYSEWNPFDAAAYFDLTQPQAQLAVHLSERVTSVHVTFYADLLLPSFRQAVGTWAAVFVPAWQRIFESGESLETHYEQGQPLMVSHWEHALDVARRARRLLLGDIGFLAANGAEEERWRWTLPAVAPPGLDPALLPHASTLPTLTLTLDFPLPIARQPGRLRRLYRHRARRQSNRDRRSRPRTPRSPSLGQDDGTE